VDKGKEDTEGDAGSDGQEAGKGKKILKGCWWQLPSGGQRQGCEKMLVAM